MKILHTSDFHLDWITQGVPRFEELEDLIIDTLVPAAIENKVDVFVFTGDLCDPDSGPVVFRAVELALRTAKLLEARDIRSIWLAGNHDVIEDGSGTTTLTPMRAIESDLVYVVEAPRVIQLVAGDPSFVCFPYVATSHAYDPEAWAREAFATTKGEIITLSHLMVPGVIPGEETAEMPRGRDIVFPIDLVAPRVKLMLQGHYHRQQRTESGIWIAGSLGRLCFGEHANTPGYLLIDTSK